MMRILTLLLAVMLAASLAGCRGQDARSARLAAERGLVNAVALAANAAISVVAAAEQREALAAIDATDGLQDTQERLDAIHSKWDRAWLALDAVAEAQDAAARQLESGGQLDLATLRAAWCALQSAIAGTSAAGATSNVIAWGCP